MIDLSYGIERRPGRRGRRASARGFTLLEVFLAIALVTLLIGATTYTLWSAVSRTRTSENVVRIEALLTGARNEASLRGRRVQLTFDAETGQPAVAVEIDPLTDPDVLTPLETWWIEQARLSADVTLAECRRTGDSAAEDLAGTLSAQQSEPSPYSPINFYPDGSSDSARIVLTAADEEDPWAVEITLNGVDGTVAARQIDLEEEPVEQP